MMTLKKFQATRKDDVDLTELTGAEGRRGWTYVDGAAYIMRAADGSALLEIGNLQWAGTVDELEPVLYAEYWAKGVGNGIH